MKRSDSLHEDGSAAPTFAVACLFLSILIVLVVSFLYCFSAVPGGDDFYRVARSRDMGIWDALMFERNNWTGRWTGIGLVYVVGAYADLFEIYPLLLILLYLVFFLALHLLSCLLWSLPLNSRGALIFTTLLFCIYWTWMPSTGQSFYWFTGAANEHLAFALGVIVFYLHRHAFGPARAVVWPVAGLTVFLLSGMHELYDLMAGYLLLIACVFSFFRDRRLAAYWFVMGCILAAGFVLIATAQGNVERAEWFAEREVGQVPISERFLYAGAHFIDSLIQWSATPGLLLLIILLLFRPTLLDLPQSWFSGITRKAQKYILLLGFLGLFLGFFGFALAAGKTPYYPRMLNLFYLWFIVLVLLAFSTLARDERLSWPPRFTGALLVVFAVVLLSGNTRLGIRQLWDSTALSYNVVMRHYDQQLKAVPTGGEATIPRLPAKPELLMPYAIDIDPDNWFNEGLADYYNLSRVYFIRPPDAEPSAPAENTQTSGDLQD